MRCRLFGTPEIIVLKSVHGNLVGADGNAYDLATPSKDALYSTPIKSSKSRGGAGNDNEYDLASQEAPVYAMAGSESGQQHTDGAVYDLATNTALDSEGVAYDNMAADGALKDRDTVTVDYCVARPDDESFANETVATDVANLQLDAADSSGDEDGDWGF
eukprot:m.930913 g.930913  ORF g.930913 m.930913 type:complete len:160 (+) comp23783_c0_seq13:1113-1592(+)